MLCCALINVGGSSIRASHEMVAATLDSAPRFARRVLRAALSGAKFATMAVRLVLFVVVLLPAFLRIGLWYWRSDNVDRNRRYGAKHRQIIDILVRNQGRKTH